MPSLRQFIFFQKCLLGISSSPTTLNLKQRLLSCLFRCPMGRDNFLGTNHKEKDIIGIKDLNKADYSLLILKKSFNSLIQCILMQDKDVYSIYRIWLFILLKCLFFFLLFPFSSALLVDITYPRMHTFPIKTVLLREALLLLLLTTLQF